MEEDEFVKSECKIDNHGNIKINIYDLLDNLSEEDSLTIIEAFSWTDDVYKKVVENVRNTYSAPNYNDGIYQLRKAFFTMPINDELEYFEHSPLNGIIRIMKDTMKEIITENARINVESSHKSEGWYAVKDYLRSAGWNDELIYSIEKIYSEHIYPKDEGRRSWVFSHELAKKIDSDEFVKIWCEEMYGLFNKDELEKGE
jgi:hypothetical protein